MSLNPIQFGKDVVDQFGRYLLTTFPVADPRLQAQLREGLAYEPGTRERLAKGPYVFLNRPFVQGPGIQALLAEPGLRLHPALADLFPFETLHRHQERSLRAVCAGRHVLMATGTGSGKTEGFLLPILDYCLKLRDSQAPDGVAAVLVYPMNALVNDQLERLRGVLAGTRVTFARYTGETPEQAGGIRQLREPRRYTKTERERAAARLEELPLPWEECPSRSDILARKPRLLLTNYSQLEYLLLRDRDLDLFRSAPLRFFVLDEVHTYTGVVGSEVACLLRRLRTVAGKKPTEVFCIGSSATVVDRAETDDTPRVTRDFAARLFGVPAGDVEVITEEYQPVRPVMGDRYTPPPPSDAGALLREILEAVREVLLADDVTELPPRVLELAARLCGCPAPAAGDTLARLYDLLAVNRLVEVLREAFVRPTTIEEALPRIQPLAGRQHCSGPDLQAEILAYLTLGALARRDDEPLLRPKLHYFVQGLHGLWLSWDGPDDAPRPVVHFAEPDGGEQRALPMLLCRSCGQHFVGVAAGDCLAVDGPQGSCGVQAVRAAPTRSWELGQDEVGLLLTDRLIGAEAGEDGDSGEQVFLCRHCGALHDRAGTLCKHAGCRRAGSLIGVLKWSRSDLAACPSCNARTTETSPVITSVFSQEVYDVMILAQTMLACMPERDLRKVLIFADSRQDAAFQAGWMDSRSLRFRIRHLVYRILADSPAKAWYFHELQRDLVERATAEGLIPARGATRDDHIKRIEWLMAEEFFASTERQRRSSLERLGLARVDFEGLESPAFEEFCAAWTPELGLSVAQVRPLVELVLDALRLRHAVSHPLLGRRWTDRDLEVRAGWVMAPDYFRPQLIMPRSAPDPRQRPYVIGFQSVNRSTTIERLLAKSVGEGRRQQVEEFTGALWDWLVANELLVARQLKVKRAGRLESLAGVGLGYQVNLDLMHFSYADSRFVCRSCSSAWSRSTPNNACPSRGCTGVLEPRPRDEEHYDVVQYTRFSFVPLLAREHSAQVPQADRELIEREFKKSGGSVNCLVSTPTLELGVDIGQLEMALMRNVPPSPANYAQRSGRAGRRHRIGVIMSYCRGIQHDQYFYVDPPAMISGQVRIPAFSMRNLPLIRKHVFSMTLTLLRGVVDPKRDEVLAYAFPSYIWPYFGQKGGDDGSSRRLRLERPDFSDLRGLLARHEDEFLAVLQRTFYEQWPEVEREVVSPAAVRLLLAQMSAALEETVGTLVAEVRSYQEILADYRRRQDQGEMLPEDERRRRDSYERALNDRWAENRENYALSYLARHGFLPGYALVKDMVSAQCLDPALAIARNLPTALCELTPANRIYANRSQYKVRRFDFYQLKAAQPDFSPEQLEQPMIVDPRNERVLLASEHGHEGGEHPGIAFLSLQMTDVELEGLGKISDQQEYRTRVGFQVYPMLLPEHHGGHAGKVGMIDYQLLRDARLRLVNLGPRGLVHAALSGTGASAGLGFPICSVCGEVRSPFASPAEIADFNERHMRRCGRAPGSHALHVDVASDTLLLGPFEEDANAVNAVEAIRIGARAVLEMGDQELEVGILPDESGQQRAVVYDPFPGGSGFLPLVMEHWEWVVAAAKSSLDRCDCSSACYKCLLHFRNQQHHAVLDRHRALGALGECFGRFEKVHDIPPRFVQQPDHGAAADSASEQRFAELLYERGFPAPPEAQYRVDLGAGSVTIADFAYPEKKLLVYIDGLSRSIHGNEEQRRKDRRLRTKAQVGGWRVLEVSAQGLRDETIVADMLEHLAILLGDD